MLTDDLRKVPEVEFQAPPDKISPDRQAKQAAVQLAKITHLNARARDGFMTALLDNRPDLAGLPFVMGDACRTTGERTRQFKQAGELVRQALAVSHDNPDAGSFWERFDAFCTDGLPPGAAVPEPTRVARVAALTQVLAAEPAETRLGLVKYLAGVVHRDATRALARLAVFSPEENVRLAAVEALKLRREKDYTDILVKGLRYPWPMVAKRATDAIARLERTDLIPELVGVLGEPDQRLPTTREIAGKRTAVVRELVKLNHHRNCVMCHAPASSGAVSGDAITAEVPIPGHPLPTPGQGYGSASSPELLVRIDVTYLRQDFSATLPVPDAHPWPEAQRFDFFVRERTLTDERAAEYRDKLTPRGEGVFSPYHRAALAALRDMTGKDAAPTAAAWRKLLNLPARKVD